MRGDERGTWRPRAGFAGAASDARESFLQLFLFSAFFPFPRGQKHLVLPKSTERLSVRRGKLDWNIQSICRGFGGEGEFFWLF